MPLHLPQLAADDTGVLPPTGRPARDGLADGPCQRSSPSGFGRAAVLASTVPSRSASPASVGKDKAPRPRWCGDHLKAASVSPTAQYQRSANRPRARAMPAGVLAGADGHPVPKSGWPGRSCSPVHPRHWNRSRPRPTPRTWGTVSPSGRVASEPPEAPSPAGQATVRRCALVRGRPGAESSVLVGPSHRSRLRSAGRRVLFRNRRVPVTEDRLTLCLQETRTSHPRQCTPCC